MTNDSITKHFNLKLFILALLMAFIVILAANRYWLVSNRIFISFDVNGQDNCSISVKMNEKDFLGDHENILSSSYNIHKNQISFFFDGLRNVNNLVILFYKLRNNNPIEIRNLKLSVNDTVRNIDLTKFEVNYGDIIKSNENSLTLKPDIMSVELISNSDEFNLKPKLDVDYKSLIKIFLLSFAFFYILFSFIKRTKKAKPDLIFLLIFLMFLCVPMSHIEQGIVSVKENRTLAKWKPLIDNDKKINMKFSQNFDEWYNDRFFLKQEMCHINNNIRFMIAGTLYESSGVFINKKNNWIFSSGVILNEPKNDVRYEKIRKNLIKFNELCKKNNIKLYVLIVPRKETIHENLVDKRHYQRINLNQDLYYKLVGDNNLKVIYPYYELKEAAKKNYMFYKCDHHWTDYGAYISYQALVKEIKKDFPKFKESKIDDYKIFQNKLTRFSYDRSFTIGMQLNSLNIEPKNILDAEYKYFKHNGYRDIKIINNAAYRGRNFEYNNSKNKLKAVLVGDSMTTILADIIAGDFLSLKKIRTNNGRYAVNDQFNIRMLKKECIDPKPDIIIINIQSNFKNPIVNMYKGE